MPQVTCIIMDLQWYLLMTYQKGAWIEPQGLLVTHFNPNSQPSMPQDCPKKKCFLPAATGFKII